MTDKVFVDSNIWLYALTTPRDGEEMSKRNKSIESLRELASQKTIVVSIQVINEFHWNMLRKFKVDDVSVAEIVKVNIESIAVITEVGYSIYRKALDLRKKYSLSFWDSPIVASALEAECKMLYTEDLQHGQIIDGRLTVCNPFL
jgi:predicted nucleic acid-binding protein